MLDQPCMRLVIAKLILSNVQVSLQDEEWFRV